MTYEISILLTLACAIGPGHQESDRAAEVLARAAEVYHQTVTLKSPMVTIESLL